MLLKMRRMQIPTKRRTNTFQRADILAHAHTHIRKDLYPQYTRLIYNLPTLAAEMISVHTLHNYNNSFRSNYSQQLCHMNTNLENADICHMSSALERAYQSMSEFIID